MSNDIRAVCPKCGGTLRRKYSDGKYIYACTECVVKGTGDSIEGAWESLCSALGVKAEPPAPKAVVPAQDGGGQVSITGKDSFRNYIACNRSEYTSKISFLQKSSVERLLDTNMRYLVTEKAFDNLWNTEEGRQSLLDCFNEAFQMAAELPLLGSVVAFGSTATFIPRVEAFQNVLCNGPNAPFEWVNIDAIHERDKVRIGRKNGNFSIDFENISPFDRGEIRGIVVFGYHRRSGMIIGECYDAETLHKIGTASSASYRQYAVDCDLFNRAVSEGTVKTDQNGREYIEKLIPKKGGGTWTKKVYRDELSNPYEGPHREKMLKKVAGKTYLNPYIKMRIGNVIIDEMQGMPTPDGEPVSVQSVDMAEEQFIGPVPAEEPPVTQTQAEAVTGPEDFTDGPSADDPQDQEPDMFEGMEDVKF